jgi:hypothetical protein
MTSMEEVLAFIQQKYEIKAHEPTTFIGFEIKKKRDGFFHTRKGMWKPF